MGHDPVEPRDHLRNVGRTDGVAHFDIENLGVGGHPEEEVLAGAWAEVGRGTVVAAGDDSGHVGAMPKEVEIAEVLVGAVEGEVWPVDDFPLAHESIDRHHAGIDESDGDALPRESLGPVEVDWMILELMFSIEVLFDRSWVSHPGV